MLLPLLTASVGSLLFLGQTNDLLDKATHEMSDSFQPVTSIQTLVLRTMYLPHHYIIYGNSEERDLFISLLPEIDEAFTQMLAASDSTEKRALVVTSQEEWRQIRAMGEAILGVPQPRQEAVTAKEMADIHCCIDSFVGTLDQLHDLTIREAGDLHENAQNVAHRALLLTAAVLTVAVGLATLAVIMLVRSILIPIRLMEHAAAKITEGDLSYQMPRLPQDELGRLAGMFSDMTAQIARRRAVLQKTAATDGLTGLNNHLEFQRQLQAEIERSERFGHPLSLLLLDIDHFKQLNDRYGHQVGDDVLRRTGALLREEIRVVDQPARYGGEEFAIILPEMQAPGALTLAERLRLRISAANMTVGEGQVINITVSIGVATFPEQAKSGKELIAAADQALYAAKKAGRNQVCSGKR